MVAITVSDPCRRVEGVGQAGAGGVPGGGGSGLGGGHGWNRSPPYPQAPQRCHSSSSSLSLTVVSVCMHAHSSPSAALTNDEEARVQLSQCEVGGTHSLSRLSQVYMHMVHAMRSSIHRVGPSCGNFAGT